MADDQATLGVAAGRSRRFAACERDGGVEYDVMTGVPCADERCRPCFPLAVGTGTPTRKNGAES